MSNEGKKKNLIRELCNKGEEKHVEREREREREREIYGRGETKVSDSEGGRKEKEKGREKEWESVPWERDCFPNFFFGKQPIENKPYFY